MAFKQAGLQMPISIKMDIEYLGEAMFRWIETHKN